MIRHAVHAVPSWRCMRVAVALLLASGCVSTHALPGHAALTPDALGAVRIGMSRGQVEAMLGKSLDISYDASGSAACGTASIDQPPVRLRFVEGSLAVISLLDDSIGTDKGIRIGDPESKVIATYGALKRTPTPYFDENDPQHQLYFWSSSGRGLLFWIDAQGAVENIEGGTDQLRAMEGCA